MEKYYKDIINILKIYGCAIKCIENPTEEMKLTAVKQNGWAISYIKNPTEEVQMLTVTKGKSYIRYIENPTDKVKEFVGFNVDYKTKYEELVRKIEEQNDYKKMYEKLIENKE